MKYVVPIIKSLCYIHVFNTYLIEPGGTVGPGMLPTIDSTISVFLIEKISTRFGKVDRGDIVVLRDPENPRVVLAKRVVGLEGDRITRSSNPETSELKGGSFAHISNPETYELEGDSFTCSSYPETYELEGDSFTYSSYPETNDLVGDNFAHIFHPKNTDKPDTVVVPKGSVWIEGDNKNNSHDSRKFGPVPYDLIRGKMFWRIYPFKKFGPFWNK